MKYLRSVGLMTAMAASAAGGALLSRGSATVVDGTKIALRSEANGQYVVAEDVTIPGGIPGRPLIASRAVPYSWETFIVKVMESPAEPPPVSPPPSAAAWTRCGAVPGVELVACVHRDVQPAHTPDGAFEVTKRVAWLLRGSGAGLLIKEGGENIVSWHGYSFSAGRICSPDGHLYKVLSDVPATNGPSWQENGYVDKSLYMPAIEPES